MKRRWRMEVLVVSAPQYSVHGCEIWVDWTFSFETAYFGSLEILEVSNIYFALGNEGEELWDDEHAPWGGIDDGRAQETNGHEALAEDEMEDVISERAVATSADESESIPPNVSNQRQNANPLESNGHPELHTMMDGASNSKQQSRDIEHMEDVQMEKELVHERKQGRKLGRQFSMENGGHSSKEPIPSTEDLEHVENHFADNPHTEIVENGVSEPEVEQDDSEEDMTLQELLKRGRARSMEKKASESNSKESSVPLEEMSRPAEQNSEPVVDADMGDAFEVANMLNRASRRMRVEPSTRTPTTPQVIIKPWTRPTLLSAGKARSLRGESSRSDSTPITNIEVFVAKVESV
jgi:hypothetical protein